MNATVKALLVVVFLIGYAIGVLLLANWAYSVCPRDWHSSFSTAGSFAWVGVWFVAILTVIGFIQLREHFEDNK